MTLIPLYAISHFNYPTTDDFAFATSIYYGLRENETWATIISNSWKTVAQFYMTWQGRYFDVMMYAFGVGTAIPELYFIGTYLVLTLFVLATVCFLRILTYKIFKWESDIAWIVATWFTIIQLWYVPHAVEAFYWYAGSVAYTLTYALALFLFSCLICYYDEEKMLKKKIFAFFSIMLSIMVAGSNYAIALLTAEIYVIAIIICYIKKRKCILLRTSFIVYMCSFACNALAPGNKTRLAVVESLGVFGSIIASLKKAASFCIEWFHITIVVFLVLIIWLCFNQVVHMSYTFNMPLLFTIISFGLFASILTPLFYAGATWGPGRLINIEYYCYFFFLVGNILYWIGWITHRMKTEQLSLFEKVPVTLLILVVCLAFLCCFKWYGLQSNNSTSALLSLLKGEARQYKLENKERWALYEDEKILDVEVEDFSVKPYVLYFDDVQTNSSDWRNNDTALFFGKKTVCLKQ